MDGLKWCSRCGLDRPLSDFYNRRGGGHYPICKSCTKAAKGRGNRRRPTPYRDYDGREFKMGNEKDGVKTLIRCACGHDYEYSIKKQTAIEWLKKKPCPKCRGFEKKAPPRSPSPSPTPAPTPKPAPKPEPVPEPEPEREPDEEWVGKIAALLPTSGVFHAMLPEVILVSQTGTPVWLQGPPGNAKSTTAEQVAKALGLEFYPVSCHELMTRSDLFGFTDANGIDHRTPLWDAFEKGGLLLLDEVDNGNPNLLAALNSALSNGHCVFGSGTRVTRHPDFRVIATANTAGLGPEHGYVGRNGVDLATRDRFVTLEIGIDEELENALTSASMGESDDQAGDKFREAAKTRLRERSKNSGDVRPMQVVTAVRFLREEVDRRFRSTVVSPRTSIHAGAMVKAGFTLEEALRAKLPGLDRADVDDLINFALRR